MPTLDTTAIGYEFQRVYGNKITTLYNQEAMTYNMFNKSARKAEYRPGGEGYFFAVRQGSNEALGARVEGAKLPEPLKGDGVQGKILPKAIYGVLRMSGLAMEAGKGTLASFVDAKGDSVMDLYKALVTDLNRQCHGDGYGLLGTLSAVATPSTSGTWTITLDNDRGVRYIRKGMVVDFYVSNAIVTSAAAAKVQSINPSTKVVTMETMATTYQGYHPNGGTYTAGATTIASGAEVVRYGAREDAHSTSTDAHRELMGLLGMYDNGALITTFENINTTNDPEFKANILSNSSVNRELSIDLMLSSIDMTAARSSREVNQVRMGIGQRRKYFALLSPDVRYAPLRLMGGYEKLGFSQNGAVNIIVDKFTQPNRLFFEPDGVIQKYELTPLGWGGFDPNKMHWRQDYDEMSMYLRSYANLGVEDRTSLTLLTDLTEPSSMPF
jgi:hypothetical protein